MAKKADGTSTTTTKVEETGSLLGKSLQLKQVVALEKAMKELEKVQDGYTESVAAMNSELNDLYYKIQEKEQEFDNIELTRTTTLNDRIQNLDKQIAELEKIYKVKLEDFTVEFDLKIKASKDKVLNQLLSEFKLARIESDALTQLKNEVLEAKSSLEKGFTEAITKEATRLEKEQNNALQVVKLTHEKEESTNKAQIEQLKQQVVFLNEQLEKSELRINNVLENQVKVAQAGKGVHVYTTDKK